MFKEPLWFLALALLLLIVLRRPKSTFALAHPNLARHKLLVQSAWPTIILRASAAITFVLIVAALARPQWKQIVSNVVLDTRDIVLTVDVSSSMQSEITDSANLAQRSTAYLAQPEGERKITKTMLAEGAINKFIDLREGDRLALFMFSDRCNGIGLLTTDHPKVRRKLSYLANFRGSGTDIVDALRCGLTYLKAHGESKSKVLILVTDGESTIDETQFAELSALASNGTFKIYVLGFGNGWQGPSTVDTRRWVAANGGTTYVIADGAQLQAAFDEIDRLEKSTIKTGNSLEYSDFHMPVLIAALVFACIYFALSARSHTS